MTTTLRHGGESHVVRPDGVMRSSIIRPIYGYQPDADVQSVVQAFTLGPPYGTIMTDGSMSGLRGAFGAPGPLQSLWLKIKTAWNAKKAHKLMTAAGVHGLRGLYGQPAYGAGPEAGAALQVAPQLAAQMKMLMYLTPGAGVVVNDAAHTLARRRLNTYYYGG